MEYYDYIYDQDNFSLDCEPGNRNDVQNEYVYNTAQNCSTDTTCKKGNECGAKGTLLFKFENICIYLYILKVYMIGCLRSSVMKATFW